MGSLVLRKAFKVAIVIWGVSACANTVRIEPSVSVVVSSAQGEIMSLVAQDFAKNPDCDYGSGESGILVNSKVVSSKGLVSDEWLAHKLEPEVWSQIAPLSQLLRSANSTAQLVDWGVLDRPGLVVRDLSSLDMREADLLASQVRCFATFMLPAISADGDEALSAFYVGPSPHGAVAFYVLRRGAAGWSIATRSFFHFL